MAAEESANDDVKYDVVMNDEEQYSIWHAERGLPPGWRAIGFTGSRSECLEHIGQVWRDMRPRSLREQMSADGEN